MIQSGAEKGLQRGTEGAEGATEKGVQMGTSARWWVAYSCAGLQGRRGAASAAVAALHQAPGVQLRRRRQQAAAGLLRHLHLPVAGPAVLVEM